MLPLLSLPWLSSLLLLCCYAHSCLNCRLVIHPIRILWLSLFIYASIKIKRHVGYYALNPSVYGLVITYIYTRLTNNNHSDNSNHTTATAPTTTMETWTWKAKRWRETNIYWCVYVYVCDLLFARHVFCCCFGSTIKLTLHSIYTSRSFSNPSSPPPPFSLTLTHNLYRCLSFFRSTSSM